MADEPAEADPNADPHTDPDALGQPKRGADADAPSLRDADTRADGNSHPDPRAVRDGPVAGFRTGGQRAALPGLDPWGPWDEGDGPASLALGASLASCPRSPPTAL